MKYRYISLFWMLIWSIMSGYVLSNELNSYKEKIWMRLESWLIIEDTLSVSAMLILGVSSILWEGWVKEFIRKTRVHTIPWVGSRVEYGKYWVCVYKNNIFMNWKWLISLICMRITYRIWDLVEQGQIEYMHVVGMKGIREIGMEQTYVYNNTLIKVLLFYITTILL